MLAGRRYIVCRNHQECGFRFIPAGYSEREAGHRSDLKPATIPK
jgi:hypothetical protein